MTRWVSEKERFFFIILPRAFHLVCFGEIDNWVIIGSQIETSKPVSGIKAMRHLISLLVENKIPSYKAIGPSVGRLTTPRELF